MSAIVSVSVIATATAAANATVTVITTYAFISFLCSGKRIATVPTNEPCEV